MKLRERKPTPIETLTLKRAKKVKELSKISQINIHKPSCEEIRITAELPFIRNSPSVSHPKAIFIAGSAGAGKTFTLKHLLPENFKYDKYNMDDYYEELLYQNGILTKYYGNYIDNTPKKLEEIVATLKTQKIAESLLESESQRQLQSLKISLMNMSQKCIREDFINMIDTKKNIIIDRPGDKSNSLLEQKKLLETNGYQTFMVLIYASPLTVLYRNQNRARKLPASVVINTWINLMKNIATYKKMFGDNFIIINNDYNTLAELDEEVFRSYFKDTEEVIKNIATIKKIKKPMMLSKEEAKERLKLFLQSMS